jgi:abhydrolase domain-containing protein 11
MAEDVVQLLHKLKLDKVSVIGHSMGGRVMMTLALKYVNTISALITIYAVLKAHSPF